MRLDGVNLTPIVNININLDLPEIVRNVKKTIEEKKEIQKLQEILFQPLFRNGTIFDVGSANPHYSFGISFWNISTLRGMIREISKRVRFNVENNVFAGKTDLLNENVVLIGSPYSTEGSREFFGYKDLSSEPETDLPFIFNLNSKDLEICKIIMFGKSLERPNFEIVDRDKGKVYTPDMNIEGFILENYLLITITKVARSRFIVNIAGCHGCGTLAFLLVFNNKNILKEIKNRIEKENTRSFQCLIHVHSVKKNEMGYIEPEGVNLVKVVPVDTKYY